MYTKVLVPLDGSEQAEKVIPVVERVLAPGGEAILVHVVSIARIGQGCYPWGGPTGTRA